MQGDPRSGVMCGRRWIRRSAGHAVPYPERLRSKPIGKNQFDQAGNPVGIKLFIADLVLAVFFSGISAPIRTRAIHVGESVLAGEAPRTAPPPPPFFHLGVARQNYAAPAHAA